MKAFDGKLALVVIVILMAATAGRAQRYWVAKGATANWNVSANWATSSNGTGGATVPTTGADAIFDGALGSNANCNLTSAVDVATLTINGYTGTITQAATAGATLKVTTQMTLATGSFVGSDQDIAIKAFQQTGGSFTSTSGTLTVGTTLTLSGGTFTPVGIMTVTDFLQDAGIFAANAATLNMNTFKQTGGTFTSTSKTFTISTTATTAGNVDFTSGTFNHNSGKIVFNIPSGGAAIKITGNPVLYNVFLTSSEYNKFHTVTNDLTVNDLTIDASNPCLLTLTVTSTIVVNGTLTLKAVAGTGRDYIINGGTIYAKGDILLNAPLANSVGTATIEINGTASTQTLTSNYGFTYGVLPNVTIKKPAGTTLNLVGNITVAGTLWNYVSGTINPGTSTIYFYNMGTFATKTIAGTHTLNNVVLVPYYSIFVVANNLTTANLTLDASASSLKLDVDVTGSVTVNGTLLLKGASSIPTYAISMRTGIINAKGDIQLLNDNNTLTAGSATLAVNGTIDQIITGNATLGNCPIPNVLINKPATSKLTLLNNITVQGGQVGWTYMSGIVDPGTSTVNFSENANTTLTIDGEGTTVMPFYNVNINNPNNIYQLGGALDVNGNLDVLGSTKLNTSAANNYPINVAGYFNVNASANAFVPNSSIITFDGSTDQDITLPSAVIYKLIVNKSAGKVVLKKSLSVASSLVLTKGVISTTTTNIISLNSGSTTTIGNSTSYIDGPMYYYVTSVSIPTATTIYLPLGSGAFWRPAEFTVKHGDLSTYRYLAQMINSSANAYSYPLAFTIKYVSSKRFWSITRNNSTAFTSAVIKLYFDTDDEVNNTSKLAVAAAPPPVGSTWNDWGGTTTVTTPGPPYIVGSITSGIITTVPSLFALADLKAPTGTDNPLPIELSSFTVTEQNGNALLSWETKSEKNNDYFGIEHSTDGTEFKELDKVTGAGTTTETSYYTWLDNVTSAERSYYRLRQVDFDGEFSYSDVVRFDRNNRDKKPLVIYSLPVRNSTLRFNQTCSVKIVDNTGFTLSSHENVEQIDVSHLLPGLYFVVDHEGQAHKITIER